MHAAHRGLREAPFRIPLDTSDFFPCPIHDAGLARLSFLFRNDRRLDFLVREKGRDNTLLLWSFAEQPYFNGVPINIAALETHHRLWLVTGTSICGPADSNSDQVSCERASAKPLFMNSRANAYSNSRGVSVEGCLGGRVCIPRHSRWPA